MRTASRFILFAITAIAIVIFYVPLGQDDYTGRWGGGTYGFQTRRGIEGSNAVAAVEPGSPAQRNGVRVGDTLSLRPFDQNSFKLAYPHVGDRRTLTFVRPNGTRFTVTLTAVPVRNFGGWDRLTGILAILPATVFLVVAFMLVYLRPNVMTWSFYAFGLGYFSTAPSYQYFATQLPSAVFLPLTYVLSTLFGNFAVMPLLPFVLRFPDGKVTGVRRRYDRAIWIALAIAFAAYSYQWWYENLTGEPPAFRDVLDTWLPLATFAVASAITVKKYKTASPAVRQRFGFLVIGLIVSFVAYAVYFIPGVPIGVAQIAGYAVVIMPVAVAYGVLRHRVLDVNFVLNRAIVYGLLSIFVIAVVSLLDWFFALIVSKQHLALAAELLATIAIGFLLDRINKGIERAVETVFFRNRQLAEIHLRRVAKALPYATEEAAVTDGLVQVPVDALHLSAAAHYRRSADGTRFEGVGTSHDAPMAPAGFSANHLLVRLLQANEERVWLNELRSQLDTENAAIYVLAMPVSVRHELVSFTLYGAHRNGAQLDPDEVELLSLLADEASRAYDHIDAVRTRERYAGLTAATETA